MVDTASLRVVFVIVAVGAFILFYKACWRPTRSHYSGWWCIALVFVSASAACFLFNGTAAQVVANPTGNILGVLGTMCVWASARSLSRRTRPPWWFLVPPVVVGVVSFLDDPANDVWTGGPAFLLGMAIGLGGATYELRRFHRQVVKGDAAGVDDPQFLASLSAITVMTGIVSAYYVVRMVVLVAVGSDSDLFLTYFGGAATTLLLILLMVVAIFSMAALSRTQYTADLRHRATHDGLTGLLNRNEFLRQAEGVTTRVELGAPTVIVLADVDRFKQLNDAHGHAAGDRALASIGTVCRRQLLPRELAGRLGGDEFAFLLIDAERAHSLAEAMNEEIALAMSGDTSATISLGVARLRRTESIVGAMERADRALYDAKARGGRRVMSDDRPA